MIETLPGHQGRRSRRTSASTPDFEQAKHFLEENDGAGNTFKATAKPVLIGTAVVGATTHDLLDHRAAHRRPDGRTHRQPLDPAPAVPARPDHRRRGHLLVHRRLHARRCPPAPTARSSSSRRTSSSTGRREGLDRGQQEGGRDLHQYAQKGMFNIFLTVFFSHPGLRLPRAVLLHRLPDLDRALRPVPGDLHGQRRRRLGQRQEDRRGRAQGEGHRRCTPPPSSATPSATRSRTPPRWR